ncbi:hypothetical protein ACWGS9_31995 [Bradyrhizobium sp. Arg314]
MAGDPLTLTEDLDDVVGDAYIDELADRRREEQQLKAFVIHPLGQPPAQPKRPAPRKGAHDRLRSLLTIT